MATGDSGSQQGYRDLGTTGKSVQSEKRARTLAGSLGGPSQRVSLVFRVDDLLLAGTRQSVTEILSELNRDMGLKLRGDDETNAL